MASPNWPGTAGFPAFPSRPDDTIKRVQLPFSTVNGESDAPEWIWGTGSPEGVIVGTIADVFQRTDGGSSTTLYVKESGVNTNTGWIAK